VTVETSLWSGTLDLAPPAAVFTTEAHGSELGTQGNRINLLRTLCGYKAGRLCFASRFFFWLMQIRPMAAGGHYHASPRCFIKL